VTEPTRQISRGGRDGLSEPWFVAGRDPKAG